MKTDAEFCLEVCRIAQEQGYKLDQMGSFQGWSFAFERAATGETPRKRVAGSIQRSREAALVNACKELLPHIYQHIFQ